MCGFADLTWIHHRLIVSWAYWRLTIAVYKQNYPLNWTSESIFKDCTKIVTAYGLPEGGVKGSAALLTPWNQDFIQSFECFIQISFRFRLWKKVLGCLGKFSFDLANLRLNMGGNEDVAQLCVFFSRLTVGWTTDQQSKSCVEPKIDTYATCDTLYFTFLSNYTILTSGRHPLWVFFSYPLA